MTMYASINDAIKQTDGLGLGEVIRAHGRLVLSSEGLFFVHGWDEIKDDSVGGWGDRSGGLGGTVEAVAIKLVVDQLYGRTQATDPGH